MNLFSCFSSPSHLPTTFVAQYSLPEKVFDGLFDMVLLSLVQVHLFCSFFVT